MTSQERRGLLWGLLAVASFSLTLPASRAAAPFLGIGFVGVGRAVGAGVLAALILWLTRQPLPSRADLANLCITALGVVVGFPVLTTVAMAYVPASHGAIVVGLLPLCTAVAGVRLTHERPGLGFWISCLVGTAILLMFVLQQSGAGVGMPDVALLGAVIAAAIGYAMGGRLAGHLGGWQVICWALVLALPVMLIAAPFVVTWPRQGVPASAWIGFAYVTLVSQLTGLFAWYHGLAIGGIARVSQTQLLQLFLTLGASALLLGETLDLRLLCYAAAVVVTVAIGTRLRIAKRSA